MEIIDVDTPRCPDCEEYEAAIVALLVIALVGQIVGVLVGLFAAKKFLENKN
ncbi:MAG: hypothetical protein FWB96_10955 [Defluviitaleaceae bacterium]|nr:hypothetical protein [Defluviitaleaceae bacterium]MCL2263493.1 hypothetical protein [Defluviitaleaceae bacterium]